MLHSVSHFAVHMYIIVTFARFSLSQLVPVNVSLKTLTTLTLQHFKLFLFYILNFLLNKAINSITAIVF